MPSCCEISPVQLRQAPFSYALVCAISVSRLAHWIRLSRLAPLRPFFAAENSADSPVLEIAITSIKKDALPTQPQLTNKALEEVSVLASPLTLQSATKRLAKRPRIPGESSVDTISLDVGTAAIRSAARAQLDLELEDNHTENSAVVMDTKLLARLNDADRVTPVNTTYPTVDVAMDGMTVREFVRVGKACFSIELSNPMERNSREMWFRVKCPY